MSNSDSEDEEYVPQEAQSSLSSSDSESEQPDSKRPRTEPEDPEAQQRKRDELWKSFQESVASGSNSSDGKDTPTSDAKTVKVEKRHLFAGKEITEIVEVPVDSPDAKKWPIVSPETADTPPLPTAVPSSAPEKPSGVKRGPRKSKITLGQIPGSSRAGSAPTKLTTLAKSAMDWRAHVDNDTTKDELEANRKQGGGGYLEKVEFLDRVTERRENLLDASKSGKRRRGCSIGCRTAFKLSCKFTI
ncbi:bucentaur or craniofacial development-domain-containing protein [Rhodocollybia butyracea]|uniref:SWR1-complex protein 5 n=1 Tax=Rhodocollybia butyracea TaxID=206335 RepID=A0A9P5U903_9AGAR|nr:bucentaur or craniofacial development-domain-containing protein [Rhodocollybia butyracea]